MAEFSDEARNMVWAAAHETPAVDVRVFSGPAGRSRPDLSGIDALLTSPEILAEFFRRRAMGRPFAAPDPAAGTSHETYIRSLTPGELADIVWRQLFIDRPPLSEATRIVLTTLGLYGLDVGSGDLRLLREQYETIPPSERLERTLKLANLDLVLYPVESMELDEPSSGGTEHPAFRPILYLTRLLGDWKESARLLRLQGFGLKAKVDQFAPLELRRHLGGEIARLKPVALGLDWPAGHRPDDPRIGRLVREAVLPLCREQGLALLVAAGDDAVDTLAPLWENHPDNRFLLVPGREDQMQQAIIAAYGSRNLLLCGPDQPLSYPHSLKPYVARRLETLGSAFHACHSGADVPEELTGCWAHMRWTLGEELIRHYRNLWRTGWNYSQEDVHKDVAAMLGGNVRAFLGL